MKKSTALFLTVGVFLLAAVALLFLKINGFGAARGELKLPQGASEISESQDIAFRNERQVSDIEINADNVRSVIASLARPDEYYMESEITYYYGGLNTSFTSRMRVRGEKSRITLYTGEGAIEKHLILTPESVYEWGVESQSYYKGARGNANEDDLARMPTYESLLDPEKNTVHKAGLIQYGGTLCIFVETEDANGILRQWYIEVGTGLLLACLHSSNDVITYRMERLDLDVSPVGDNWFVLPSGAAAE